MPMPIATSPLSSADEPIFVGRSFVIGEDSTLSKAIACVPLVGTVYSFFQEASLVKKLNRTMDAPEMVALITVKNHYKVANIARTLLSAALVVGWMALGVLRSNYVLAVALYAGIAGINLYQRDQNKRVIEELQANGFRIGMRIV